MGTEWSARLAADKQALARIYESLRPYGGVLHLLVDVKQQAELLKQVEQAALEQAVLQTTSDGILVRREGPLPEQPTGRISTATSATLENRTIRG
ncbi:MAG: hypothetical protein R3C12_04750 [Planctomycetaceae bacterium]